MKTITLPFPDEFSGIYFITLDGIKYINSRHEHKKSALSPTPTKAKGKGRTHSNSRKRPLWRLYHGSRPESRG